MNPSNNIAHVRQNDDGSWTEQSLVDHLESTARLARKFAESFGAGDWASLCALWHDLGKFVPAWQKHIRQGSGYDLDAHIETLGGKVNHSSAGAVLAFDKIKNPAIARILAYPIAGHHAGLPDWYPDEAPGSPLPERVSRSNDLNDLDHKDISQIQSLDEVLPFLNAEFPSAPPFNSTEWQKGAEHLHLWIRMIFSCLVDADFLDTESFMAPRNVSLRKPHLSIRELKNRFDLHMNRLQKQAVHSNLNKRRSEVLEMCRKKALFPPGFYTLTVPTGGGKTLSSVAFALEHALKYSKDRIIVAIPYTSIIEQTAKVLKYGSDNDETIQSIIQSKEWLFGEENVVEHHSNLDPEKETHQNRLASENWDAPVIVTTNVQLFESLLSSKSSSCRKLHNIANSVIILDEAQMLPPEYLIPVLSVLQGLVKYFGVTIVLCTATQPALSGPIGSGQELFHGLPVCTEIIDHPSLLTKDFRRVNIHFPTSETGPSEWTDIAEQILDFPQCLAVVNSRMDCRTLHSLLPEDTIHLSANMCGEERSDVINEIKEMLRDEQPVRVVSTQLIEAGVDIDFPVVFRAMAGLDSIAQAAGRCNREGKLNQEGKLGKVFVFNPPRPSHPGLLRKGEDACRSLLRTRQIENLDPEIFNAYFKQFYSSVRDFDYSKFRDDLCKEAFNFIFQFRSQSRKFKVIDDAAQRSVVIWYQGKTRNISSREYIEDLRRRGPNRPLSRRMQRFTVNVPEYTYKKLWNDGMIEEIHGLSVQRSPGLYRKGVGLVSAPEEWSKEFLCI